MKSLYVPILVALFFTAGGYQVAKAGNTCSKPKQVAIKAEEPKIEWLSIEEACKRNRKKPKKIIVDVYTNWCGWCKKMDKITFGDPKVAEIINKDFYAVKFNAEGPDNVIFNDELYKFNSQRNANDLAVKWLNGEMGYPTIVYLNEKMETIKAMQGYYGPEDYPKVLEYIRTGAYKKKSFEQYIR